MTKFIKYSIIFLVILIIIAYFLDYTITSSLKKSKRFNYAEWNALYDGKINAEMVIYGSSRAYRHFDPKIFEDSLGFSVYNLGLDGYRFQMQYARHLEFIKHNKTPNYIVFSVDEWSLSKFSELYMSEQFLPYFKETTIRDYTTKFKGFDYWDYHLPFVRYFGNSKIILHAIEILFRPNKNYTTKYKGYQGSNDLWNDSSEIKLKLIKKNRTHYDKNYDFTMNVESILMFKSFLNEIKRKNIKAFFVLSPTYIEGQNLGKDSEENILFIKQLVSAYKFDFLDFSSDTICSQKKYFYNSSHLNKNGATVFSMELASIIKKRISN